MLVHPGSLRQKRWRGRRFKRMLRLRRRVEPHTEERDTDLEAVLQRGCHLRSLQDALQTISVQHKAGVPRCTRHIPAT